MKTRKTTTIILSGGFHTVPDLTMRVNALNIHPAVDSLCDILSESQYEKASDHFCGIKGCTCGSLDRVDFEVK